MLCKREVVDGIGCIHVEGLYDSVAAFFTILFANWFVGNGTWAIVIVVLGARPRIVDCLHLEDNLEGCVEHFVKSFLLFSGAHDKALEGVLLGGLLDLLVADA